MPKTATEVQKKEDGIESEISGNGIERNDRLTEVPRDILSFILSFVSFRDAIKSRILSRRWKSICPFMLKNLDFNPHSVLGIDKRRWLSNRVSSEDLCKFVRGVDQFVELYKHEKNSILPEAFRIHVLSLRLKTLILHDCYCLQKIEIYSASLTTFEYTGQSKRLSFLHVPLLEKVHIKFLVGYKNHTRYMFNALAKDLPQLQILSVVLTKNELPVPRRITTFSYLKQLELFVLASPDYNLLSLTSLINAAPLLQKFNLSLHNWRSEDTGSEEQYSEHAHLQLKEVEVHGFCGTSNQMELAIYLLNNAVSLDRMTLTTQRRSYRGDRKWTSTSFYWIEWENKKEHAYDLLLKQRVNSRTNLVFL
ncbi:hypothetical protein RHGRI_013821 [Rhododendron griersonianum]|uniref:F-box domain-containing protein n=1 Tax=Rhododendron griersonianum TaxID=479676 RepID=A0AAV6K743_9ERIC|nr:hypothetical protein RHGRI_013821 [Rhododendron griersonianum]